MAVACVRPCSTCPPPLARGTASPRSQGTRRRSTSTPRCDRSRRCRFGRRRRASLRQMGRRPRGRRNRCRHSDHPLRQPPPGRHGRASRCGGRHPWDSSARACRISPCIRRRHSSRLPPQEPIHEPHTPRYHLVRPHICRLNPHSRCCRRRCLRSPRSCHPLHSRDQRSRRMARFASDHPVVGERR